MDNVKQVMTEITGKINYEVLDARGLFCPEPMMLLHKKLAEVQTGALLQVLATDPSTTRDIAKLCRFLKHELVDSSELSGEFTFVIRKC